MASTAESTVPLPVMMMNSLSSAASRIRLNSSMPSMPGIFRSARTSPYSPDLIFSQAALPSVAVSALYPSSSSSIFNPSAMCFSSSAMSRRAKGACAGFDAGAVVGLRVAAVDLRVVFKISSLVCRSNETGAWNPNQNTYTRLSLTLHFDGSTGIGEERRGRRHATKRSRVPGLFGQFPDRPLGSFGGLDPKLNFLVQCVCGQLHITPTDARGFQQDVSDHDH